MTTATKDERGKTARETGAGAAARERADSTAELEKELNRDVDAMMEQIAIESDRLIERRKEPQEPTRGAFGLRITF